MNDHLTAALAARESVRAVLGLAAWHGKLAPRQPKARKTAA